MNIDWGIVFIVAFVLAFGTIVYFARKQELERKARKSQKAGSGKGNAAQKRAAQIGAKARKRDEALFVSMFPDLQPHFHPEALVQFVRANLGRKRSAQPVQWQRPPGFGVPVLEIQPGTERIVHVLRSDTGDALSTFEYDDHPEGGVLRVGKGKFTVNVKDAVPRVRYWHPEREFKWSEKKGWVFTTAMAAAPFAASSDNDRSRGSDSTDWTSRDRGDSREAFAGGGGTFDGGGASGGWDESSPSGSSGGASASGDSSAVAGDSGSGDSTSTSY